MNIKLLEKTTEGRIKEISALQQSSNEIFFINDAQICPQKGEIKLGDQLHSVEPKVMEVLLVLCRQINNVVTPEQIFEQVWPRSIYNPSSIRRCIAILRKCLQDDSKSLIKTHPKRGYILQAQMTTTPSTAEATPTHSDVLPLFSTKSKTGRIMLVSALSLLLLSAVALGLFSQTPTKTLFNSPEVWQVSHFRPLTASNDNETYARYIDGNQHIVFIRHSDNGPSQLWLKSLQTNTEQLLLSSKDSILFFEVKPKTEIETKPNNQTEILIAIKTSKGVEFNDLIFNKNYELNQSKVLFSVPEVTGISAFYSDTKHIYFLGKVAGKTSLYSGSIQNGTVEQLLTSHDNFTPYRISRSLDKKGIAVLGFNAQHTSQIWHLSIPDRSFTLFASLDQNWYFIDTNPNFSAYLLSDGKSLFQLNASAHLLPITFENYAFLHFPGFSPDGQKLIYTRATFKGDIGWHNIRNAEAAFWTDANAHSWQGALSRDGNKLAYISNKNGHSQVFVKDLTTGVDHLVYANQEQYLALSKPVWSPQGDKLASARNDRVFIVNLETNKINHLDTLVGQPEAWHQDRHALFIRNNNGKSPKWFTYDVKNKTQTPQYFPDKHVGVLTNLGQSMSIYQGRLYDDEGQVLWRAPNNSRITQHFSTDAGLYFIVIDNTRNSRTVWYFAFKTQTANLIIELTDREMDISDFRAGLMVFSTFESETDIMTLSIK